MVDGDEEKRETWAKIIETRINIGVPYIIFRDNMNEGSHRSTRTRTTK